MNILMTGSTGFIGAKLKSYLQQQKHDCRQLMRLSSSSKESPQWDFHNSEFESVDAIVHLAGENIAAKRWSEKQKKIIYNSRIEGTKNLINKLIKNNTLPKTFVCASAIGYYGDRKDERLTEESSPGDQFVSRVCADLESCTDALAEKGVRVLRLRFGVVLGTDGGALKKMLLPFKMGLGGVLGDGNQIMSWISVNDLVRVIDFALNQQMIEGAVNLVSPHPVSNRVFTRELAKALNKPALIPMPGFVAKLAFGEMAKELLLSSQEVVPQKLKDYGFEFTEPDIKTAFAKLLS